MGVLHGRVTLGTVVQDLWKLKKSFCLAKHGRAGLGTSVRFHALPCSPLHVRANWWTIEDHQVQVWHARALYGTSVMNLARPCSHPARPCRTVRPSYEASASALILLHCRATPCTSVLGTTVQACCGELPCFLRPLFLGDI